MGFLWFAALGAVTGWLTGLLMRDGAFGVTGDAVVGSAGALIGSYFFRSLALPGEQSLIVNLIVAAICATILLAALRLYASHSTMHRPVTVRAGNYRHRP
jgi:uncharacterized membrane protein YeaQ/YmgE (transglycosylase-associated protein family)